MKINRIKIEKLFGALDHDLKIENQIEILFGKNGCGKTTILKILNSVISGSLYDLRNIKFKSVELFFSDNSKLLIQKANDNQTAATRQDHFDKKIY